MSWSLTFTNVCFVSCRHTFYRSNIIFKHHDDFHEEELQLQWTKVHQVDTTIENDIDNRASARLQAKWSIRSQQELIPQQSDTEDMDQKGWRSHKYSHSLFDSKRKSVTSNKSSLSFLGRVRSEETVRSAKDLYASDRWRGDLAGQKSWVDQRRKRVLCAYRF